MRKAGIFLILSLSFFVWGIAGDGARSGPRAIFAGPTGSTDYPWTMFHHDSLRSGVTQALAPNGPNLGWSFSTGGLIYSSPAVADGIVFIASHDGYVYAIDERTGLKVWAYYTGDYVSSSPAVVNGIVYVTAACPLTAPTPFQCQNGAVYALNELTGSVVWQDGANINLNNPITSSPLVADGKVFFGTLFTKNSPRFYALNATSGSVVWQSNPMPADNVESMPSVDNGRVFYGANDGSINALNESTGQQLWSVTPLGLVGITSAPTEAYGMVFLGTDTRFLALDERSGATRWTFNVGNSNSTSAAVNNGVVYFGSGRGNVYALNATTGAQIWAAATGAPVNSSPALSLGSKVILVGSSDHYLYALNATTGVRLWRFLSGGEISSSPAIADARAFFGGLDGKVYGLGVTIPKLQASISSNSTSLKSGNVASISVAVTNGTMPVSGVNVTFTSSAGGVFTKVVMTSPGTYVSNFTAPTVGSPTSATIQATASKSGHVSGSAQTALTINPLPALTVSVSPKPPSISPGGQITLEIMVKNGTQLVSGATIFLASSAGGSFSAPTDGGNGNYTSVYTAPVQGASSTITVQASKNGFSSGQSQVTVTVVGPPDIVTTIKALGPSSLLYLLAGFLLIFLILVLLLASRRNKAPRHYRPPPPVPSYMFRGTLFRGRLI